jgi:hypothetical protein
MFSRYAFFGLGAFFLLWAVSIVGAAALCCSWLFAKTDYEDGVLSRNSRYLITTRALLAAACIIFWICTCLGHVLTASGEGVFMFWEHHPAALQITLIPADLVSAASTLFSWQLNGPRSWVVKVATAIFFLDAITSSIILWQP